MQPLVLRGGRARRESLDVGAQQLKHPGDGDGLVDPRLGGGLPQPTGTLARGRHLHRLESRVELGSQHRVAQLDDGLALLLELVDQFAGVATGSAPGALGVLYQPAAVTSDVPLLLGADLVDRHEQAVGLAPERLEPLAELRLGRLGRATALVDLPAGERLSVGYRSAAVLLTDGANSCVTSVSRWASSAMRSSKAATVRPPLRSGDLCRSPDRSKAARG